jgi:hypothetical protein
VTGGTAMTPHRRRQVIASALVLAAVAVAFYLAFIVMAVTRA